MTCRHGASVKSSSFQVIITHQNRSIAGIYRRRGLRLEKVFHSIIKYEATHGFKCGWHRQIGWYRYEQNTHSHRHHGNSEAYNAIARQPLTASEIPSAIQISSSSLTYTHRVNKRHMRLLLAHFITMRARRHKYCIYRNNGTMNNDYLMRNVIVVYYQRKWMLISHRQWSIGITNWLISSRGWYWATPLAPAFNNVARR